MNIEYNRSGVFPAMALVGPLAILIVLRVLLGNGPTASPAATDPAAQTLTLSTPAPVAPAPVLTTQQQETLAWLLGHPLPTKLESPMYQPPAMADIVPVQEQGVEDTIQALADQVHLSSIAGTGNRAVASISGKLYRVGDKIRDDWTITKIDVVNRQVTCQHTTGIIQVLEPAKNASSH